MPVLVKAIFICMTVTSFGGMAPTSNATKCIPIEPNQTKAVNEEASIQYDVIRTLFFLPIDSTEEDLSHGDLILGASMDTDTEE
jgi:hypothetical protein